MAVPYVGFDAGSASSIECVSWAVENIVQGELSEEASKDIPGSLRLVYRVADEITTRVFGPAVIGDADLSETDHLLAKLAEANNVHNADGYAAISPAVWITLIRILLDAVLNRAE